MIQSHLDLFMDELSTIKGITAKLEMKQEVTPKFYKARTVPYALQEAVEEEYNHLERYGIVQRLGYPYGTRA